MCVCHQLSNSWKRGSRHSCSSRAETAIMPQPRQAAALCRAPRSALAPQGRQSPPCAPALRFLRASPCVPCSKGHL